jgi:hypothetical protein
MTFHDHFRKGWIASSGDLNLHTANELTNPRLLYDNPFHNQKHLLPGTGETEQPYLRKQEDPSHPRRPSGLPQELKRARRHAMPEH